MYLKIFHQTKSMCIYILKKKRRSETTYAKRKKKNGGKEKGIRVQEVTHKEVSRPVKKLYYVKKM